LEVEVHRPFADAATAEVGDHRLAKTMQQRAAEQDRNSARPGVDAHVADLGGRDLGGVDDEVAGGGVVRDLRAVKLKQTRHDFDVSNVGNVAQRGRGATQERSDHRLGDEVLGAANGDF